MKLKTLTLTACAIALLSGCDRRPEPTYVKPLFCDLYEPRRFTQTELDWRITNAPTNIRADLINNEDWKGAC
jgi:hypothetical protein